MERWIRDGQLVAQNDWNRFVDDLKEKTVVDETINSTRVKDAFITAVRQRLPRGHFGVFLSGGVDSSLIALAAQKLGGKFTCYTVGYGDSEDVRFARVMAEKFCFDWKLQLFSLEEVEGLLRRSASLLAPVGLLDPVHVSIGAVVIAAVELAGPDRTFLGGLGAEEIFAGYQRHVNVKDVNKECWRGLKAMWATDLKRDAALGQALGVTVCTPFLDPELISVAMQVPGGRKVVNGERKVVLREVASDYGVPHEIAWRRKKAAQYGSGFDKALSKLARQKGLTKERYVKGLVSLPLSATF